MNIKRTILSKCRTYRYTLWREWKGGSGYALFMGLNPSTADETIDDRTIGREIEFAKEWGYAGLAKWNLFGYRATKPKVMKAADDPVGPDNDRYLLEMAKGAGIIVAGWGTGGGHLDRDRHAMKLLEGFDVHCLKVLKRGHPGHPLYIVGTTKPIPWKGRPAAR